MRTKQCENQPVPSSFASHFAPVALLLAFNTCRRSFRPSGQLSEPCTMAGFNVFAVEVDEEAHRLRMSALWLRGPAAPLPLAGRRVRERAVPARAADAGRTRGLFGGGLPRHRAPPDGRIRGPDRDGRVDACLPDFRPPGAGSFLRDRDVRLVEPARSRDPGRFCPVAKPWPDHPSRRPLSTAGGPERRVGASRTAQHEGAVRQPIDPSPTPRVVDCRTSRRSGDGRVR